jgi:hypothetical protein
MEADYGGLANQVTVRFQPIRDLSAADRERLLQDLVRDFLVEKGGPTPYRAEIIDRIREYLAQAIDFSLR